jgi:hypothetical protein
MLDTSSGLSIQAMNSKPLANSRPVLLLPDDRRGTDGTRLKRYRIARVRLDPWREPGASSLPPTSS